MFLLSILSLSRNANRACLHGDGGPQVGEVTRLGGVTRFSIQSLISHLIWSRLHDRWGDPPGRGWIRDTSNSRKIHFGGGLASSLKLTIESHHTEGCSKSTRGSVEVH